MNANERIGWINKLNKKDAYIKTLTEGIRDLNTKIYQDKMAADAVNERKNKQIAEQQAEISVSENLVKHLHSENKQLRNENEELQAENQFFKDVMGDVEILRKAQEK